MRPKTGERHTQPLVTITALGQMLSSTRMSMNDWWLAITTAGLANVSPVSFRRMVLVVTIARRNPRVMWWIDHCTMRCLRRRAIGSGQSVKISACSSWHPVTNSPNA